jgi:5-methylthioadenosine/S-adenosylhomocysteine deaminase
MKILIKDAKALLYENDKFIIKDTSILINGKIIEKIGEVASNSEYEIIDGKNKLVVPGFINTHGHLAMSMFRNYGNDVDLDEWLNKYIFPKENMLKLGDCYYYVLLSICEMLKSGVTYLTDMYFFMEEVAKAIEVSGIKGNISRSVCCFGDFTRDNDYRLQEAINLYKNFNGQADERIKVSIAPHSIYTCTPGYLRECGNIARELNADLQIHMCETVKEVEDCKKKYGVTPFEHCENLELFDINTNIIAAHCVHLSDIDFEIIKKRNIHISHNPTSNLKLASGIANITKAIDMGINVALGTDGAASNNNQSIMQEMKIAGILQKGITLDPKVLDAHQVLKMATINGAKASGISDIGQIKEGMKADIAIIDIDKPHYYPIENERLISAIIYSANSADVDTVIIDGKIVMKNRKMLTIDEEKVKYECGRRF